MKFKDMKYERPDMEAVKALHAELTERFRNASSYEEAKELFLENEKESKHISTMATLASIRHSIDTRDEFYDAENDFWDGAMPLLNQIQVEWKEADRKSVV